MFYEVAHLRLKPCENSTKCSSRSSRVVVEMSHVLPSSSTRRSGNAKYDVEEEEEIELFSDDEMVPHHEHEIEMVDV